MRGYSPISCSSVWIMSFRNHRLLILSASDDALQEWHSKAMSGDTAAMDRLMLWAYWEANRYYKLKSRQLAELTPHDAEDLASEFILDFQRAWRDVRSVARYTRFVLKKNLTRHLISRSHHGRSVSISLLESTRHAVTQTHAPWMRLSDRGYQAYSALCDEFFVLPTRSRVLIRGRLQQPPVPYSTLCDPLGLDVATARMQVSRFFDRVRRRCENPTRSDREADNSYDA